MHSRNVRGFADASGIIQPYLKTRLISFHLSRAAVNIGR
jgi:hypothetical protein